MILFSIQTPSYQEVDFIHISNRERVTVHLWRQQLERITCQWLIGGLKQAWKIIIFLMWRYGFSQW